MPFRFPIESFFQISGSASAAFGEKLRDEVATFACELWSLYPDWMTRGLNPANAWARGYMNHMCSPVQPPAPAPPTTFTGGQCPGVLYRFQWHPIINPTNNNNDPLVVNYSQTITDNLIEYEGPISEVFLQDPAAQRVNFADYLASGKVFGEAYNLGISDALAQPRNFYGFINNWGLYPKGFVRSDGMPDTCGNLPNPYNSPDPTSDDLIKEVPIPNPDGIDNVFIIQYNKQTNNYTFPIGFKVNGINVTIDIGGMVFYAPNGWGNPSGGNDVPPPGSDGGDDGEGGGNTTIFFDNEYPIAPENPVPREVTEIITSLVCTDGVIETIETSLQLAVGFEPILSLIIEILGQILTDLCETPEASLSLPEYYGLRPGVDRPAIVYLWKEFIGGRWGASTYSSTVHHPTAAAIANIPNLTNIQKFTGQFRRTVSLLDGSQVRTTGNTAIAADNNFNFLVNQVDPVQLPTPLVDFIIESEDTRIAAKTLTLRQVEYYPDGKKDNTSPAIKRTINPNTS